jgi:pentachlorophenol monooxygenase/3-(3-hydroxy-phenyl)propionate hydroxylase
VSPQHRDQRHPLAPARPLEPLEVRALPLAEIDATGAVREGLAARPDEVWVIRPDAHVAAVLTAPAVDDVA